MSIKNILVTGGAGFIGTHLCERLLAEGHCVICMDNLFTSQKHSIRHLLAHENFEFIRHDVIQPFQAEVDEIYHLACPASPPHYQHNPIQTIETSYKGTLNALTLAHRLGAKLLFTSTSEVYGDPLESPQKETYWGHVNPIGLRSCYDEGKRIAETLCTEYRRKYNIDVKIVRIFNTYGSGMHPFDGRVVSNFIVQALSGQNITIYGDGSQTRSFCYVSDLVDGLVRMMQSSESGPINLGNPNEMTIRELASAIVEKTKSDGQIVYTSLPADDPKKRCPNISLAAEKLDWTPTVSLDEGLNKTISYFKSINMKQFKQLTT